MKVKKEFIILAVVIIALTVYLVMRSSDRTQYRLPDVPQAAAKDISRLQITRGQTTIIINKKDDKWYIAPDEFPADANKVKNMLNAVEKLTLTALVSESKNYNLYDLNEDKKLNVKAWQGEDLKRDFDLGKTASSFRHTFVRPAGDERVFHARGNFKNNFDFSVDDLRDKLVLALNPADIKLIQVIKDQQTLTISKSQAPVVVDNTEAEKKSDPAPGAKKSAWQAADGRPVEETAVNQLLNAVSDLRCEKFINDRQKEDFTSPLFTLQLKGGQEYSLTIFAKTAEKDTDFPAVSSGSNYPFLLSGSLVESIMIDPSEILKTPATNEIKSN
ncbi:MAG: DUF4340 domain-containing protein [Deltaproteobacteria bacterium]|nr:DUF4340 domain-containing protein [Deltaproteobacteria bacterium]